MAGAPLFFGVLIAQCRPRLIFNQEDSQVRSYSLVLTGPTYIRAMSIKFFVGFTQGHKRDLQATKQPDTDHKAVDINLERVGPIVSPLCCMEQDSQAHQCITIKKFK